MKKKTHRSTRVHTTVLMRFRLSMTLERSKTIELHVVTEVELHAHAISPPYYSSNKLQESVYNKKA